MATPQAHPRLGLLYFALFDDCNVKCDICDCWRTPPDRRTATFYLATLTRALALRPLSVRFTGGEPLLLAGLPTLVGTAAQTGARVSVITNGRLLASKAAPLADSGCQEIVVSIDGVGDAHDQMRGTPRLFQRLSHGIRQVCRTGMAYGVNTVVRSTNIDALADIADFLRGQPRPPSWWHLIPVRDRPALLPSQPQRDRLPATVSLLRSRLQASGTVIVADETMFDEHTAVPCEVPDFAAFLRADTSELFGCNMLAYSRNPVGTLDTWTASGDPDPAAVALRQRCRAGTNPDCGRCDPGSRAMNHHLLRLARTDPAEPGARPVVLPASEARV
jgi:pyruvate-formate lyase-activating enzyme